MLDPRDLFSFNADAENVPSGLHMIAALSGFTDAGSTLDQVAEQIFKQFDHEIVVEFENDELLDYRSRRPLMFFEKDHISEYAPPVLAVYQVWDEAKQPFLFLHGYEPDLRWEAFSDAVQLLIQELDVQDFTWVHSIPFPIPHTREIGITVSGNRQDIIDRVSEWKPQTQVPGNVLHLIEFKLQQLEFPTLGYVLLVPHYLADSEYPAAGVAAIENLMSSTGLVFATDELREANRNFTAKLNAQVAENEELQRLVSNLEQGYAQTNVGPSKSPLHRREKLVPDADSLAAELEDFLAARQRNAEHGDIADSGD
ncbi:MAG: proteasome assembly chaperone family protein [Micrococcales bacterium]